MTTINWLLDIVLGITLLWLAGSAVFFRGHFSSIAAFIAFGMLMALAWVQLGAVDIAIAEAALGGGVTGALLLAALRRLQPQIETEDDHEIQ